MGEFAGSAATVKNIREYVWEYLGVYLWEWVLDRTWPEWLMAGCFMALAGWVYWAGWVDKGNGTGV